MRTSSSSSSIQVPMGKISMRRYDEVSLLFCTKFFGVEENEDAFVLVGLL